MTIKLHKRSLLLVIGFILFISFAKSVTFAVENSDSTVVQKYGITFPIAELNNCDSISACKTYCNDTTHLDACTAFAKKKGFYKEQNTEGNATILKAAQTELGCSSMEACKTFCSAAENADKCKAFAQKYSIGSSQNGPKDNKTLQKAKEILGCESETSCKAFCQNPDNQQKCSDFAKQAGLNGGIQKVGPGGCTSGESCLTYCQSHENECKQFGANSQNTNQTRVGPGGCAGEAACKAYCQSHAEECKNFSMGNTSSNGKNLTVIRGPGGCNTEDSCRKYCAEHAEECKNTAQFRTQPQNGQQPIPQISGFIDTHNYCKEHPDKCGQNSGQNSFPQPSGSFQPTFGGQTQGQVPSHESSPVQEHAVQGASTHQSIIEKLIINIISSLVNHQ